jgi:hypothetical protein
MFSQLARQEAISLRNIISAWRAVGLEPFNPTPILSRCKPKMPPFASLASEGGVRVNIELQPDLAQQVN